MKFLQVVQVVYSQFNGMSGEEYKRFGFVVVNFVLYKKNVFFLSGSTIIFVCHPRMIIDHIVFFAYLPG